MKRKVKRREVSGLVPAISSISISTMSMTISTVIVVTTTVSMG